VHHNREALRGLEPAVTKIAARRSGAIPRAASRITKLRVRHGLPPFDDPLWPKQPDNRFMRIRRIVLGLD
jgi:hypothetical protein